MIIVTVDKGCQSDVKKLGRVYQVVTKDNTGTSTSYHETYAEAVKKAVKGAVYGR